MKKKPIFTSACGGCGGSRGILEVLVSGGFSSTLWEFGKIVGEEHRAEWRWRSLAPSGTELVTEFFTQFFSPTLAPQPGAGAVCASFPVPIEPPSVSALEIFILCEQGSTCQPVNLYPSPPDNSSLILFRALMNKLLRTCSIRCVLVTEVLDEVLISS